MNEDKTTGLTPEQMEAVRAISERAYSPEAAARLKERAPSDEEQARLTEEWNEVYAEAGRLAAAGADPSGPEGRALGARYGSLLRAFTQDDPELVEGPEPVLRGGEGASGGAEPVSGGDSGRRCGSRSGLTRRRRRWRRIAVWRSTEGRWSMRAGR